MSTDRVVGIDVGGTETKAVLTDAGGIVCRELREPTPAPGPDTAGEVVRLAAGLAGRLARTAPVAAVGLVVPGVVGDVRGIGVYSESLGWRDVPFAALLGERTGLPVAFGHDVRAGGLAESRFGAAAGFHDVMFLPIGTGIAAALVLDGRPHVASGYAGEIGHVPVADGPPCSCGLAGCLESVASAAAIARRYVERSGHDVAGAVEVARRVASGDRAATAVWEEALDALALALCWAAGVLAPDAVVIGGGLSQAGPLLFEPLARRVAANLTFHKRPAIVPAALGDRAGCLGATLLATAVVEGRSTR